MISDVTLAAIRSRVDIVSLIGETVKLKKSGRAFMGPCPFHSDKHPSFSVSAEHGRFNCWSCKESGSAIDFVMKLEGKTFPDAVRALAERLGIEVEDGATDAERREAAAARRTTEDLYAIVATAAAFYESALATAPSAHAELDRRGLTASDPAVRAFRVGYAPDEWGALVEHLRRHGISPALAERVGLIVPRSTGGSYYDRFRHRLMFAVHDVQGRAIAFSGRALPGAQHSREETPAKYINSPESPIYTKGEHLFGLYQARQDIRQKGEAVLVEGNFDVVALHARGLPQAVAPLGTAFTPAQARLLRRFAPSVTVLFDGDAAGRKATWAARVPCREACLSARAAGLPRGLDPDEMARRDPARLTELLTSAPPLTQRLLDMVLRDGEVEGAPVHDPTARARAAVALIAEGSDDIERAMLRSYAAQVAAAFGVEGLEVGRSRPVRREPVKRAPLVDEMALAMLGCLIDYPALFDDAAAQSRIALIEGDAALAVVALRTRGLDVDAMPESVRPYVARRLARPVFESQDDALRALCAYAKTLAAAKRRQATTEAA